MANTTLEEQLLVLMKRGSPDVVKTVAHAIKANGFDYVNDLKGAETNITLWDLDDVKLQDATSIPNYMVVHRTYLAQVTSEVNKNMVSEAAPSEVNGKQARDMLTSLFEGAAFNFVKRIISASINDAGEFI